MLPKMLPKEKQKMVYQASAKKKKKKKKQKKKNKNKNKKKNNTGFQIMFMSTRWTFLKEVLFYYICKK